MRILLAIDDSEHSDAATKSILARPWPDGSSVRVLCVARNYIPVPGPYAAEGMLNYAEVAESLLKNAEMVVGLTATKLGALGLPIEHCVRQGDPRQEIVEEAKDWRADLVIVGSHSRTGVERWLLGSVAEHVVRHAPCSVEVARQSTH